MTDAAIKWLPGEKRWYVPLLRILSVTSLGLIMTGCGGESVDIPAQQWQNLTIHVESRPSPPRPGMNEFLVIATEKSGRPGYNLLIQMRDSDQEEWTQAIEDGDEGVYRRAVNVMAQAKSDLQVKITRGNASVILYFPLKVKL